MSNLSPSLNSEAAQERDAFSERMVRDLSGVMSIFSVYIGVKLGLYNALVEGGPATSAELAARTSTQERYIREWLEQQTVGNILVVDDENLGSTQRRYSLPPIQSEILTDHESVFYFSPTVLQIVGSIKPLSTLLDAYRSGGGVPFDAYGTDLREGVAMGGARLTYIHELSQKWIPVMADVHNRLQINPPARVADIGCGFGWSSIGMAQGYPKINVDGFDLDGPSIDQARINADENHVADRVSFHVRDAADPTLTGQYDLVTAFETLHDMSDPVSALRSMHRLATDHGTVLIADMRTPEKFTAQGTIDDFWMYSWSIFTACQLACWARMRLGLGL